MKIGILALQGAFIEHGYMLDKLHVEHYEIRQKKDLLIPHDGLIIPGGESTVIAKLLKDLDIFDDLKKELQNGMPIYGTCAGLILLAKEIESKSGFGLNLMDINIKRNAYGRQLGSFVVDAKFATYEKVKMVFIRAPYIINVKKNVQVLATINNHIVAAQQDNMLVTAFHPELTNELVVHKYFIDMIKKSKK